MTKYTDLKTKALQSLCRGRDIAASGNKSILIARLEHDDLDRYAGGDDYAGPDASIRAPMAKADGLDLEAEGDIAESDVPTPEEADLVDAAVSLAIETARDRVTADESHRAARAATVLEDAETPAREPDASGTGHRYMVVPMTPEQLAEVARDMVSKMRQASSIAARRAAINSELGGQVKALQEDAAKLAEVYQQGGEYDNVETALALFYRENLAVETYPATGDVLDVRELLPSERQPELPGTAELVDEDPAEAMAASSGDELIERDARADEQVAEGWCPKCGGDIGITTEAELEAGSDYGWTCNDGDMAECLRCGVVLVMRAGDIEADPDAVRVEIAPSDDDEQHVLPAFPGDAPTPPSRPEVPA